MTKTSFERQPSKSKRFFSFKRLAIIVVIAAIAGGLGYLGVKYNEARNDVKRLSNPEEAAKQEISDLTARVSKLVEVPSDQEPTVATVQDVAKLGGQEFFKNAQNGDKVLIYTQAKKAILYRPSTDKIINVAPVNIGDNQQQTGTDVDKKTDDTAKTESDSNSSDSSTETNTRE